jgi:hypothetical protein
LHGERDAGPTYGSLPLLRWAQGPLSVPSRLGTPAYIIQAKTKVKACTHALSRATAAPEPASLLREGSGAATCLRVRTPPFRLGELRCCHVPRGSGPHLTIQQVSDAGRRTSAPDLTSLLRRAPALTHILQLRTAPASVVGSGADTYPMALRGPWAVEIKEDIAASACNKAHVFPRHTHVLPRRMQDVQVDDVIMTYKTCGHALQHRATVLRRVVHRSQAGHYSTAPCI